jgi:hypothetical protein
MGQKGFAPIVIILLVLVGIGVIYLTGGFEKLSINTPSQLVPSTADPVPTYKTIDSDTENQDSGSKVIMYPLAGSSCDIEGCLFKDVSNNAVVGFASIRGYYTEYAANDQGTQVTCKGFVVTGGNEILIKHFNDWIKQGNFLNKIIDNNLVVNINIEPLDNETKTLINGSSKNSEVVINVIREIPIPRGALSCTSVIQIISARRTP